MSKITDKIKEKYEQLGENPDTHLQGLLHAKPINYWDYVEVETLLSLQRPRTFFKDEEIFIMYHQVTELMLKMMLHEIKQIVAEENITEPFLVTKVKRMNRYTSMLITSFDIMKDGMDYNDYNTFRATLTPASGFQSVQFRYIEILCTPLKNLLNQKGKERTSEFSVTKDYFDYLYWKDAGMNRKTGAKTLTLSQFEEKYQDELIALADQVAGKTIAEKVLQTPGLSKNAFDVLKEFDHLYNVAWPLVHLQTAAHYLDSKGENKAATGGSEWKKYLHPKYQQRKFFPALWDEGEMMKWGALTNEITQ